MKKNRLNRLIFLLVFILGSLPSVGVAQSIEKVYGLELQKEVCFQHISPYKRSIDSTQVTKNGNYPLRLQYNNLLPLKSGMKELETNYCRFVFSRTILLPSNEERKEDCTVSLNCKTEIDRVRFIVIARDTQEELLYVDSVVIHPTGEWADYSLTFCSPQARTVTVIVCQEGCNEENQLRSIYLDKISLRLGKQDLNDFPIHSLVDSNQVRLRKEALLPLFLQDQASLKKIEDWKDKKIIAIGESINGLEDLMKVQIQLIKHLITWENCRLIIMDLDFNQCVRWNLYLQGLQKDTENYEEKLKSELENSVPNFLVFFEFLQWLKEYNSQATDPVRIVGIKNSEYIDCLTDYLLKLSTTLQDSLYYIEAVYPKKMLDLKKHLEQSQISKTLNKKDFDYLLFILQDVDEFYNRPFYALFRRIPDSSFDEIQRIKKVIDILLTPEQKAVFMASSVRINKYLPIHDIEIMDQERIKDPHDLGYQLHQHYGSQYHTISIQLGKRTCLKDSIGWSINSFAYPVNENPFFPFSFEQAAMDSEVPYFYYPSEQLPDAICGLNLFPEYAADCIQPFCNCYIPLHFDALVFIRQVKGVRIKTINYNKFHREIREEISGIYNLLKNKP